MLYYCLVKKPEKKTIAALMMVCVRVVGLREPSSSCGSPWPPHRLSSLARAFALALVDSQFQSVPLLPLLEKKQTPRSLRS